MAPIVPTMKYENSLLPPSPPDKYLPKDGTLFPFCSVPLKGLVYDAAALSFRTAVQLRARAAAAAGLLATVAAERRASREAVVRGAIFVKGKIGRGGRGSSEIAVSGGRTTEGLRYFFGCVM